MNYNTKDIKFNKNFLALITRKYSVKHNPRLEDATGLTYN